MIYLTSTVNATIAATAASHPAIGLIVTPDASKLRHIPTFGTWAADNACFSSKGRADTWDRWLLRLPRKGCLFAAAPDVPFDFAGTWKRSAPLLPMIRDAGFPSALVAQNGFDPALVEWDAFDCLFLGGDTAWKTGIEAVEAARAAKAEGKWVHMGRVNSVKRMLFASSIGCDSCDGTFLRYSPTENLGRLLRFIGWTDSMPGLEFG